MSTAETTEKTGMTKPHVWVRAPREKWKNMDEKDPKASQDHPGWWDVFFDCETCECYGHVMWRDGPLPECPEEAVNLHTMRVVDPFGDCVAQLVESVHAR